MKKFTEYLTESKKTYEFKIRVAGELPKEYEGRLETALQKYQVENMSAGKRAPISKRPIDFPNMENSEVTTWEVELGYPVTSAQLQEYLTNECQEDNPIVVRNPHDPAEEYQEEKDNETYESMLDTDYEDNSKEHQKLSPNNQVMDLLKELEVARKERDIDPIQSVEKAPEAK